MSIVQPRANLHRADLLIEREIRDVYLTGDAEANDRRPEDLASVLDFGQTSHVIR